MHLSPKVFLTFSPSHFILFIHCQEVQQQDQPSNQHVQSTKTGLAPVDDYTDIKQQSATTKEVTKTSDSITVKKKDSLKEKNTDNDSQNSGKIVKVKKSSKSRTEEEETAKQSRSKLIRKVKLKEDRTLSDDVEDLNILMESERQEVCHEESEPNSDSKQQVLMKSEERIVSSLEKVGLEICDEPKKDLESQFDPKDVSKPRKNEDKDNEVTRQNIDTVMTESKLESTDFQKEEQQSYSQFNKEEVASKKKSNLKKKQKSTPPKTENKNTHTSETSGASSVSGTDIGIEEGFYEGEKPQLPKSEQIDKEESIETKDMQFDVEENKTSDNKVESSYEEEAGPLAKNEPSQEAPKKSILRVKKRIMKGKENESEDELQGQETVQKIHKTSTLKQKQTKLDEPTLKESDNVEELPVDEKEETIENFSDAGKQSSDRIRVKVRTKPKKDRGNKTTLESTPKKDFNIDEDENFQPKSAVAGKEYVDEAKLHSNDNLQDAKVNPKKDDVYSVAETKDSKEEEHSDKQEKVEEAIITKLETMQSPADDLPEEKSLVSGKTKRNQRGTKKIVKEKQELDEMLQDQEISEGKQDTQNIQSKLSPNKVPFFLFYFNPLSITNLPFLL